MPEGAARIERIDLEGVRLGEYVFVAHTKPPRFAIVGVRKDGGFWAAGPLTREQLDIELGPKDEVPLSAEGREAVFSNPTMSMK